MDTFRLEGLSLDDLRLGSGRWRNIQDSVRFAIGALCATVTSQQTTIANLEAKLDALCDHFARHVATTEEKLTYHDGQLQAVNRGQVLGNESASVKSATLTSFDTRLTALEEHSTRVIGMIRTVEAQVPAIADLRAFATKSELADKASIADVNEALSYKANKDSVEKALRGKANVEDTVQRSEVLSRHDWDKIVNEVNRVEKTCKDGLSELSAALGRKVTKAELAELRNDLEKQLRRNQAEASEALAQKVSRGEFSRAIATKADAHTSDVRVLAAHDEMLRLYKQKADAAEVSQLKRKADASEVQQLMKTVADLQLQLQRKADCSEVVALQADLKRQLDTKADASDVKAVQIQAAQVTMQPQSTALKSPPRAKRASGGVVSSKSSSPEPSLSPPRSAVVMQPVTACVQARWIWKSRELLEGNVVPWEVEALNEAPELLNWRAGKGAIVAVKPGLYQLCAGFFSPSPPTVTVFIDNHAALSKTPSTTGTDHATLIHRHPAGCVGGTSVIEFLALPARASVTVTFASESPGQGFLWLLKL